MNTGDYKIGETLLDESASTIILCPGPPPAPSPDSPEKDAPADTLAPPSSHLHMPSIPSLSKYLPAFARGHSPAPSRSPSPSPEPQLTQLPPPPTPRRLLVLLLGLKPHRAGLWTTSQRPSESVISYILLNGCPAVVVPAKLGAPLLAWDGLTLAQLQKLDIPADDGSGAEQFKGVVNVLFEYLSLCIDWERVVLQPDASVVAASADTGAEPGAGNLAKTDKEKEAAVRDALVLLLAAAVRSKDSKQVKKEVDSDRAGVVMFRIP